MTNFKLQGTITRVWEAEHTRHVGGVKDEAAFETEKLGWYIEVNRLTSFFVGYEKPDAKEGEPITICLITGGK